ncbi:hypothetical protein GGI05_007037, partial [Coemansia sp. RSA 2603]
MVYIEQEPKDSLALGTQSAETRPAHATASQQHLSSPSSTKRPAIHRSQTTGLKQETAEPIPFNRSSTDGRLVAANGNTEDGLLAPPQNPHRQSYAHRRSVSGWDRLFENISQRAENNADEEKHVDREDGLKNVSHEDTADTDNKDNNNQLELRVPGIGEDSLAHGDVQYVY